MEGVFNIQVPVRCCSLSTAEIGLLALKLQGGITAVHIPSEVNHVLEIVQKQLPPEISLQVGATHFLMGICCDEKNAFSIYYLLQARIFHINDELEAIKEDFKSNPFEVKREVSEHGLQIRSVNEVMQCYENLSSVLNRILQEVWKLLPKIDLEETIPN